MSPGSLTPVRLASRSTGVSDPGSHSLAGSEALQAREHAVAAKHSEEPGDARAYIGAGRGEASHWLIIAEAQPVGGR